MKETNGLLKIEDINGLNHLIQSSLKTFESKGVSTDFSIKYVSQGEEFYKIDGEEYQVNKGNFLITNPDQEIEINVDSSSDVIGLCYFFDKTLVQQMRYANTHSIENNLDNIDLQEKLTFRLSSPNSVDNIPIHAAHTYLSNFLRKNTFNVFDKYQISAYLMLMAEYMVKHQDQTQLQLNNLESTKTTTKIELYKRLQSGRQFIHDNLERPISLKEMGKAACLSEYYFHRNFRNFFKLTPHQYHHLIRMWQAHYLLKNGKFCKKEVAFKCGFNDAKYFSKAYKKWTCSTLQI